MPNKITLITPPDYYENENLSVLLIGITEDEQTLASQWLGEHPDFPNVNFYFYQNEQNVPWLLYAVNRSTYTYLNLDMENPVLIYLSSYILGKPSSFYKTSNLGLKEIMQHINNQYVPNIEKFLEKVFNG